MRNVENRERRKKMIKNKDFRKKKNQKVSINIEERKKEQKAVVIDQAKKYFGLVIWGKRIDVRYYRNRVFQLVCPKLL